MLEVQTFEKELYRSIVYLKPIDRHRGQEQGKCLTNYTKWSDTIRVAGATAQWGNGHIDIIILSNFLRHVRGQDMGSWVCPVHLDYYVVIDNYCIIS